MNMKKAVGKLGYIVTARGRFGRKFWLGSGRVREKRQKKTSWMRMSSIAAKLKVMETAVCVRMLKIRTLALLPP